jgi:hypothetical protein
MAGHGAALRVAHADDVAAGVVGLAQGRGPLVVGDPGLAAADQAARAELAEREPDLGVAVVVGAGRGELDAVGVGDDLLGEAVARGVRRRGLGVDVGRDALVAGDVDAGLAIDAAKGALLEDIIKGVVVPLGADARGGGLGTGFDVEHVRGGAANGLDAGGGRLDLEGVQLAGENTAGAAGLAGEELELACLVLLAEVVAAGECRGLGPGVAGVFVALLGEAAEFPASGVVPAVADAVAGRAGPGRVCVGFVRLHEHRGRGRGSR